MAGLLEDDPGGYLSDLLLEGEQYEKTRALVGGEPVRDLVVRSFLAECSRISSSSPLQSSSSQQTPAGPKLSLRVSAAAERYARSLPSSHLTASHIEGIVSELSFRWDKSSSSFGKKAGDAVLNKPLTQVEKNRQLAAEIQKHSKDTGDLVDLAGDAAAPPLFEREDAAVLAAVDAVVRCAEDKFLAEKKRSKSDVKERHDAAQRAMVIGDRRMVNEKDVLGAAAAYRFGLWQLNFANREDVVWFTSIATPSVEQLINPTVAHLHAKLSRCLVVLASLPSTPPSRRLVLAAEAAAQASGALEVDPSNCDAIFQRGRARLLAEDFEPARIDMLEACRREPANEEYRAALKGVEGAKSEALKRETALWEDEDQGKRFKEEEASFMGAEESPYVRSLKRLVSNPVVLCSLLFLALAIIFERFNIVEKLHEAQFKEINELIEKRKAMMGGSSMGGSSKEFEKGAKTQQMGGGARGGGSISDNNNGEDASVCQEGGEDSCLDLDGAGAG